MVIATRKTRPWAIVLLVASLVACEAAPVEVTSPAASIVVHAVLNPDADEQVVLVEASASSGAS